MKFAPFLCLPAALLTVAGCNADYEITPDQPAPEQQPHKTPATKPAAEVETNPAAEADLEAPTAPEEPGETADENADAPETDGPAVATGPAPGGAQAALVAPNVNFEIAEALFMEVPDQPGHFEIVISSEPHALAHLADPTDTAHTFRLSLVSVTKTRNFRHRYKVQTAPGRSSAAGLYRTFDAEVGAPVEARVVAGFVKVSSAEEGRQGEPLKLEYSLTFANQQTVTGSTLAQRVPPQD